MKLFATVTRYLCLNCKQEFKTDNRHDCKRDPDKKNCFTCKHNKGWNEINEETAYVGDVGYYASQTWAVDCAKAHEPTASELSRIKYKLNCPDWEMKEEEEQG